MYFLYIIGKERNHCEHLKYFKLIENESTVYQYM